MSSSISTSKKERKKLKKLQKRTNKIQPEKDRSGLLKPEEWHEYRNLFGEIPVTSLSLGPLIGMRQAKERLKVEGVHHRDLLAWLLIHHVFPEFTTCSSGSDPPCNKKRKNTNRINYLNPSIPSWATIHNPACTQRILVLELQFLSDSVNFNKSGLMHRCFSRFQGHLSQLGASKSFIHLPTQWFQGNGPKSISDCLLRFPPVAQRETKRKNDMDLSLIHI